MIDSRGSFKRIHVSLPDDSVKLLKIEAKEIKSWCQRDL